MSLLKYLSRKPRKWQQTHCIYAHIDQLIYLQSTHMYRVPTKWPLTPCSGLSTLRWGAPQITPTFFYPGWYHTDCFFQFICISYPHTGLETSTGWFPGVSHGAWYTFQYQISVLANSRQTHECTHKGNECFFSWCVFTGDRYPSDRGLWGKVFLWALYKPTMLQ